MHRRARISVRWYLVAILCIVAILAPSGALASTHSQGPWWDVPPEPENPSPYYDSILYSEIPAKLHEIQANSNRVKVEVIGQSAGGRNLFLATVSAPEALGRLGQYQAIRQTMLKDPEKAQEMIDKFGDLKVPVFINASIHGNEYPGVDAAIRLIETLAYEDTEEVHQILDHVILLVNVVQNPDGRVLGQRQNANGFDFNRDFVTQSQPETRATVRIFTEWNPMVVLDLHGFMDPMTMDPTTPPHNPNHELDLYIKWSVAQAEAMEAELFAQTGFPAVIGYRDWPLGWDDWAPIYTEIYSMYFGAYGHCLETPYRDERGVDAHYAAVWGALKFVAENNSEMVRDQIELFRRGLLDLPQQPIPPELLPDYPQYEDVLQPHFPAAYAIPQGAPFQVSPHQAARLVDFLLYNDVQVEQASQGFTLDGVDYPKGTYVVWLDQPKRGLANVILEDGLDMSDIDIPGLYFYSPPATWSNPLLWGVYRAVMEEKMDISTNTVNSADPPRGSCESGKAGAYAYLPTSLAAFRATNDLLARGVSLYRAPEPFDDKGRHLGAGAIILPADPALANEMATGYALDVFALKEPPAGAVPMYVPQIAVYGDEGVRHALGRLGFAHDAVSTSDLNAGVLADYDVFINQGLQWTSLDDAGRASFQAWYAAGGNYVALPSRGRAIDFAVDAGIASVTYGYIDGNAILEIDYDPDDAVAAGFAEDGYAFVYRSLWFMAWDGLEVSASVDAGDFLVSGYWPGWQTSGANGMPIVVHSGEGDSDLTLIGFDATFRSHPEDSFRILGNAIYNGFD